MTKLYNVRATIDYVIAVDEDGNVHADAQDTVREACHDIDIYDVDLSYFEITDEGQIAAGWNKRCYPYRTDGTTPKTIEELLKANNE